MLGSGERVSLRQPSPREFDAPATGPLRPTRLLDGTDDDPRPRVHRCAKSHQHVKGGGMLVSFKVADVFAAESCLGGELLLRQSSRLPSFAQLGSEHRREN